MTTPTYPINNFKDISATFPVDMSMADDFEEITGTEFYKGGLPVSYEDMMVMELLWYFDNYLRKTEIHHNNGTAPFLETVDRRKEFGVISIMEDYLPNERKKALWKYYYRRSLDRDIHNKLSYL